MGLITELKRRNVFKVGAAYIVVGWLLIQAADILAPQLGLPEWAPRLVTFLVLLGFPIALVLAWIFDLTPEGMQVTEGRTGSRRFYAIVALVAIVSLGWFAYTLTERAPGERAVIDATPSIAVLAFDNMSPDPGNAFFAEGISEEILNILAGIEGLHVASRTSAFSFKGQGTSIPEIARALNVAHVLEGSVRRQGDRVRITAQLIHADTDYHLWSETYDRELTDIFVVQEEIAQAIATALEGILGIRRVTVSVPTQDLEAYEHFLRGRHHFYDRANLDDAIADLRFAVQRDRDFTEAWAYLASVAFVAAGYSSELTSAELRSLAESAAERALALDPDNPQALAVMGTLTSFATDPETIRHGVELLERAAAAEVQHSTARLWYGIQLMRFGDAAGALPYLEAAHAQDPLVAINNGYLGIAYLTLGRDVEAFRLVRRAADMADWNMGAWVAGIELANRGDFGRAPGFLTYGTTEEELASARENDPRIAGFLDALEAPEKGREFIDWFYAQDTLGDGPVFIPALVFGDAGYVVQILEGYAPGILMPIILHAWLPSLDWLRRDPRLFALLEARGIVGYWESYGYPPGCRRASGDTGDFLDCPGMRR